MDTQKAKINQLQGGFHMFNSTNARHERFTLIELFTVIAVIAILASLLLPSLQNAKGKARGIQCAESLKQIGLAETMYSGDSNGWIAICDTSANITWRGSAGYELVWHMPLYNGEYIKNGNTFLCQSANPKIYSHCYRTYGAFRKLGNPSNLYRIYPQLFNIANPSSTLLFADAVRYVDPYEQYSLFYTDVVVAGMGYIHLRHVNTANCTFVDGHVEAATASRLRSLNVTTYMGRYNNMITP